MSVTTTVNSLITKLYAGTLQPVDITKNATYKARTVGTYNVSTGARTFTETSHSIKVIDKGTSTYVEDGVEKYTGVYLIEPITGLSFIDTSNDTLTVNGIERKIVGVKPISLGSTDLLYELRIGALPTGARRKIT